MDFGLGFTATIEVARRSTRGEWLWITRMLSTMFWTYVAASIRRGFWASSRPAYR